MKKLFVILLSANACGGGDFTKGPDPDPSSETTSTSGTSTTSSTTGGNSKSDISDCQLVTMPGSTCHNGVEGAAYLCPPPKTDRSGCNPSGAVMPGQSMVFCCLH